MPEPTEAESLAAARAWVEHMRDFTLRLVRMKRTGAPGGIASGFLVEAQGRFFVLTAGHSFKRPRNWVVETTVQAGGGCLAFRVDGLWQLTSFEILAPLSCTPVDFAWCELNLPALKVQLEADPKFAGQALSLPWYRGPFGVPVRGDSYGFASWSRVEYHAAISGLHRETACEIGMQYDGLDPALNAYRFRLARAHKGHRYYRGASGAPIADPTGQIVSLVLGGHRRSNTIYGLPLTTYFPAVVLTASA